MSMQQLADRTDELGMPIPQSVLANLESGRRETVSVAELLVLAAALDMSPLELMCPVGFDKQIEMLPGHAVDPLIVRRWITGMLKLDVDGAGAWTMRTPGAAEQGNAQLLEYHDLLIAQLRAREAEAAQAADDLAKSDEAALKTAIVLQEARQAAAAADAAGDATAAVLDATAIEAGVAADTASREYEVKALTAQDQMHRAAEWREFIRAPLRQVREEMRRRGVLLPDLPADIELVEDDR
jgi:transcriptional regulator with XRE-family HTH domain